MFKHWIIQYSTSPTATYATLNPSDKSSYITLSNWNLTCANTNASWRWVRWTIWKSSWKWYWEVTLTTFWGSSSTIIWIGNVSESLENYVWVSANGWSWYSDHGWWHPKIHNTVQVSYWTWVYVQWDIIWVALNMDNNTITMYKNWTSQWEMYSWVTWTIYPMSSPYWNWEAHTYNFWATAFTYSVPSGFNAWLYN